MNKKIIIQVVMLLSFSGVIAFYFKREKSVQREDIERKIYLKVRDELSRRYKDDDAWPERLQIENKTYGLKYTLDRELTDFVKELVQKNPSDYTSVVIMENNSSNILTAIDYSRENRQFGKALTFSSTSPAASLFKVVTAAEVIENQTVDADTGFSFRGRSTTLYRYQLNDTQRYSRRISFEKAFASSNNVVFAKAAIENSTSVGLFKMAEKFGFNQDILGEISSGMSQFPLAENQYNLAELASGFNRVTTISPVHAASIATVIANNGVFKYPQLLSRINDSVSDKVIWKNEPISRRILKEESSQQLQRMMRMTVEKGTARAAFRRLPNKIKENLEIGGKTGSITGGIPYGKRDWFIVYAIPKDKRHPGISIAVMIVNVKKWYVRSSYLAKNIIEYYYKSYLNNPQVQNEQAKNN
jgi:cell division protein FtsI/penicillin-binding protein 2